MVTTVLFHSDISFENTLSSHIFRLQVTLPSSSVKILQWRRCSWKTHLRVSSPKFLLECLEETSRKKIRYTNIFSSFEFIFCKPLDFLKLARFSYFNSKEREEETWDEASLRSDHLCNACHTHTQRIHKHIREWKHTKDGIYRFSR